MFGRVKAKTTTPEALGARDDVEILDVREHAEWAAGHVEGARHLPLREIVARAGELDASRPLVAVCRSGARSGQVAALLNRNGYDVTNLEGGLQAWERAGLPLVSSSGDHGRVI